MGNRPYNIDAAMAFAMLANIMAATAAENSHQPTSAQQERRRVLSEREA